VGTVAAVGNNCRATVRAQQHLQAALQFMRSNTQAACRQAKSFMSCLLQVPLDHSNKQGACIKLFVRDVSALSKIGHKLPTLLFLQGWHHLPFAAMPTCHN